MNPIRSIRNLVARAFSQSATAWLSGREDSGRGGAELRDIYGQSEIVYACVQVLVDNLAFLPFCIRSEKGAQAIRRRSVGGRRRSPDAEMEIESGPVVDLFNRPHPQLSRFDFWEMIIAWLHVRGTAFVVATDDAGVPIRITDGAPGQALPTRLVILQADHVVRIVSANELIGWHYFSPPGCPRMPANLLPEEVLQIRLPGLTSYVDGMAPGFVAQLAAQGDYAAGAFMKGLMANNADTGLIVSSDQWLTDEQRNQITAALRERKRTAGTADRPLLLGGGLRVEKPSVAAADAQYLASRDFNRRQICAVLRVPEFMLGITQDANRSIGVEQRAAFIQNRICPLAVRLATAFDPIARMFDPTASCRFDVDCHPAMVETRRARFASARQAMELGIPLNDLNEVFDLGLEPYPWGNRAFMPFGLQEVGADTDSTVPPDTSGGGPQPAPEADAAPSPDNPFRALAATLRERRHVCGAHEAWVNSVAGSVRKKKAICRSFFFSQRARVLRALQERFSKAAAPEAARAIDDLWDAADEDLKLQSALKPALLKDIQFGGAQVWKELALPNSFNVAPADAIEFLAKRSSMIRGINEATWTSLRDSLSEGLQNGDTYPQLVDRVKEVYATASQGRAEMIAMTETNVAVNAGRFDGMREAGVERKAWLASNLAGSRASHQQAGRDYGTDSAIPIDEPFRVDGEHLDHPGDPNGSPGNVINCRCTVLAVLGDKAIRTDRMLSYEEWLAAPGNAPGRADGAGGSQGSTPAPKTVLQEVSGVLQLVPETSPTTP